MSRKLTIFIDGLHCAACEILTEDALKRVPRVTAARVDRHTGKAELSYESTPPDQLEISRELEAIGYRLNKDKGQQEQRSDKVAISSLSNSDETNCDLPDQPLSSKYRYALPITIIALILVYWLINHAPMFDLGALIGTKDFSLPLALIIGLVAGVSTCLALTGGLALGLATSYAASHPQASRLARFKPQLLFNLGRVIGFFFLGGILGLLGTTFKLSPFVNSLLVILVGMVILFLGLKLLNISPALNSFSLNLPKKFSQLAKTKNALLLGALTFFIPCGFTQAVQIYAIGTGDFIRGGLTMALFAIGTAPGLLGIGGLAALWNNQKKANKKNNWQSGLFLRIAGAIIVIFALMNLNNGLRLLIISNANSDSGFTTETNKTIKTTDDVQIIRMTEHNRGYTPNRFTIKKDVPVRWIIDAQAPYSCASALIIPSLKIQRQLKPGENIIEFTPTKAGEIPFSCSMGMYTGSFTVIDK